MDINERSLPDRSGIVSKCSTCDCPCPGDARNGHVVEHPAMMERAGPLRRYAQLARATLLDSPMETARTSIGVSDALSIYNHVLLLVLRYGRVTRRCIDSVSKHVAMTKAWDIECVQTPGEPRQKVARSWRRALYSAMALESLQRCPLLSRDRYQDNPPDSPQL
nr:hypothetical protein CFP56_52251 [Quercus suber]